MLIKKIRVLLVSCLIGLWAFSSQAAEWTMASGYPKSKTIVERKPCLQKKIRAKYVVKRNFLPLACCEKLVAKSFSISARTEMFCRVLIVLFSI